MSGLRYLLDTNIVSNIARYPKGLAAQRLMIADARHVGVSIVVARALDLTLVTDNLSEFSRVPGLAVENWLIADA
jgi:predicted nucleic acid-binding protein